MLAPWTMRGPHMGKLKSLDELFTGRHFDRDVIILCVRWYLRFKLSLRDLVEMMAERGLSLAHTTIMRWVRHYAPEFEKRWRRYALAVGRPWRVDKTYVKIRGEWCYLYRAVDRVGVALTVNQHVANNGQFPCGYRNRCHHWRQ
jgi:transposase-like protein